VKARFAPAAKQQGQLLEEERERERRKRRKEGKAKSKLVLVHLRPLFPLQSSPSHNPFTIANPIPLLPPVTSAICPEKSTVMAMAVSWTLGGKQREGRKKG